MDVLLAKGPDAVVDIDQACLAETMDMIGLFGFHYHFNAIRRAVIWHESTVVILLAHA